MQCYMFLDCWQNRDRNCQDMTDFDSGFHMSPSTDDGFALETIDELKNG